MDTLRCHFSATIVLSALFIIVSVVSVGTSIYYLLFEALLSVLVLFLFFMRSGIFKSLPVGFYIICIIFSLVTFVSLLIRQEFTIYNMHYIVYYLMCLSIYAFFRSNNISSECVLKSINVFYLFYLAMSILMWVLSVKFGAYALSDRYTLGIFGINKSILLGVNGSPASLDSFSALVFLLNLFFGVDKRKNLILSLALIAIVLSLRLTPMVAMTITILFYFVIKNRMLFFSSTMMLNLVYVLIIYLAWVIMQNIETVQDKGYTILHNATHARFVIWGQQINVMLENYSFSDYMLGGFRNETFNVALYQVSGEELTRSTFNPHSSILLLFFRNPFLFVLMYSAYMFLIIKNFTRRKAAISVFIFLSLTMNSSLLATGNPVFTIVMILLALPDNLKQKMSLSVNKNYVAT